MSTTAPPDLDRLVLPPEACRMLGGIHRCTLDEWVKRGVLPPPTRLTRKHQGWPASVLNRLVLGGGR